MRRLKNLFPIAAFVTLVAPVSAQAAALSIVNVGAPAVNCIFNVTCTEIVTDSIGTFTPPGDSGSGRLQSRTSPGIAPAPAGSGMDYEYRVDMTEATGSNCVVSLKLKFGPVIAEPYPPGPVRDVYVVTSGGLGSVGVDSATQINDGDTYLTFGPKGVCPGQTSYFFGLTSATTNPRTGEAIVFFSLGGGSSTAVRAP